MEFKNRNVNNSQHNVENKIVTICNERDITIFEHIQISVCVM